MVNDALEGTLSSYSHCLLLVHFLQSISLLPNLQDKEASGMLDAAERAKYGETELFEGVHGSGRRSKFTSINRVMLKLLRFMMCGSWILAGCQETRSTGELGHRSLLQGLRSEACGLSRFVKWKGTCVITSAAGHAGGTGQGGRQDGEHQGSLSWTLEHDSKLYSTHATAKKWCGA